MSSIMRRLLQPLYVIAGVALMLMIVIILMQVLLRYLFSDSFVWGEEMARFMMIAAALLGAVIAHASGSHIRFELLDNILSAKTLNAVNILSELLSLIIAFGLLYAGYRFTEFNVDQTSLTTGISMLYVYSIIPISMALFVCISINRIFNAIQSRSIEQDQIRKDFL